MSSQEITNTNLFAVPTTATPTPRLRSPSRCRKCQNHGLEKMLVGHKKDCQFKFCICIRCSLTKKQNQQRHKRAMEAREKEKELKKMSTKQLLEMREKIKQQLDGLKSHDSEMTSKYTNNQTIANCIRKLNLLQQIIIITCSEEKKKKTVPVDNQDTSSSSTVHHQPMVTPEEPMEFQQTNQVSLWPDNSNLPKLTVPDAPNNYPQDLGTSTVTSSIPLTSFCPQSQLTFTTWEEEGYNRGNYENPAVTSTITSTTQLISQVPQPYSPATITSSNLNLNHHHQLTSQSIPIYPFGTVSSPNGRKRKQLFYLMNIPEVDYLTLHLLLEHLGIRGSMHSGDISRKLEIERQLSWLTDSVSQFTDAYFKVNPRYTAPEYQQQFCNTLIDGNDLIPFGQFRFGEVLQSQQPSVIVANPSATVATTSAYNIQPDTLATDQPLSLTTTIELSNDPDTAAAEMYPITKKRRAALLSKVATTVASSTAADDNFSDISDDGELQIVED